jgi:hypothetical protein
MTWQTLNPKCQDTYAKDTLGILPSDRFGLNLQRRIICITLCQTCKMMLRLIVGSSLFILWTATSLSAFAPRLKQLSALSRTRTSSVTTTTELYGLLGRFRNKRTVEQVVTIQPGARLPAIDVERLVPSKDGTFQTEATSIADVVGNTKALLIGTSRAILVGLKLCLNHLIGSLSG